MTNPTPHGQVPEALRLAEQYDHGDPAAHGNAWKAAVCTELRRQHARIAELEAELEAVGAGGVQALSAAPKPTCGKCKGLGYYDEGHEYEDGTMGGGNYVDCERCKPVYREKLPDGKRCLHGCHKSEPCHTAP